MENLTLFSVSQNQTLSQSTKTNGERAKAIREAKLGNVWPSNYFICKTVSDLGRVAREIATAREFAFDCETNSLYHPIGELLCLSIWVNEKAYLINFKNLLLPQFTYDQVAKELGQYFTDDDYKKYGFNIKFDAHWIERFLNLTCGYLHFDAYLASWFIETDLMKGQRGLKALCERYLGIKSRSFSSLFGSTSWSVIDPTVAAYYACKDAEMHYKLCKFYEKELETYEPHKKLFYDLDMPVMNMDFEIERNGFRLDREYLANDLGVRLEKKLSELAAEMAPYGLTPNMVNSSKLLPEYLFETLGLPRISENSTASFVLEQLESLHPVIKLLQEYREVFKLKTAFVDSLLDLIIKDRIHPSVKTIGTETSRSAMESPNMQQMPADEDASIRRAFMAEPGYMLVSKDLKGQELRILAHFCGKGKFASVAVQGTIYEECAATFYNVPADTLKKGDERRDNGKKAWLAMQYGAQAGKIAGIFKSTKQMAQDFLDNLFKKRFPEIGYYQEGAKQFSRKNKFIVGIFGRKRHLHYEDCQNVPQEWALEREAINTPIQQTAAEQLKLAFLLCNRWLIQEGYKTRAVLRVHDELLFHVFIEEWNEELDKMLDNIIVNAIKMDVEFETTTVVYGPDKDGISRWGVDGTTEE